MIEKLKINYASAIYPSEREVAEKINEIIERLNTDFHKGSKT